jgi:hypothetical protein
LLLVLQGPAPDRETFLLSWPFVIERNSSHVRLQRRLIRKVYFSGVMGGELIERNSSNVRRFGGD